MMVPAFLLVGVLAASAAVAAGSAGGVLGVLLAVVAGLVAAFALGTAVFTLYGRFAGMWWLFTPEQPPANPEGETTTDAPAP